MTELTPETITTTHRKQIIKGTIVIRATDEGVPNLKVYAYDGDKFNPDDLLGDAMTDLEGKFIIIIDDAWRIDDPPGQKIPDVYFRLFNGAEEIPHRISASQTKWNKAKDQYTVLIKIEPLAHRPPEDPDFDDFRERFARISENIETMTAYAPTTYETGLARNGQRTSQSANVVSDALRDILGKRVNATDVKGLRSALDRVFEFDEDEGKRIARWKPPTYAVETELGAELTGAQASFYHYIKKSVDEIRVRVNALRPLQVDADDDLTYATRSSFLAELDDLLAITGRKTELRAFRVNKSFDRLNIYLKKVEKAFGFKNQNNVHTIEDERALTDFLITREYLNAMKSAWENFRDNGSSTTLGSRLIKLEHLLNVVSEGTDEVYTAMDAISFDEGERKGKELDIAGYGTLSVQDIFDWVLDFSTRKAPNILKEGGKGSLKVLFGEAKELHTLVDILCQSNVDPLKHPRIRRKIEELRDHLEAVKDALN